jgi:hypothetical protein
VLACVHFENESGRRTAAKLLTRDEARRIAATGRKNSQAGVRLGAMWEFFVKTPKGVTGPLPGARRAIP